MDEAVHGCKHGGCALQAAGEQAMIAGAAATPSRCLQTVPVVVGGPETDGACPPAPAGALPTQPDSVDENSKLCAADWQQALVRRSQHCAVLLASASSHGIGRGHCSCA